MGRPAVQQQQPRRIPANSGAGSPARHGGCACGLTLVVPRAYITPAPK
jgi:hypothetical protein